MLCLTFEGLLDSYCACGKGSDQASCDLKGARNTKELFSRVTHAAECWRGNDGWL